MNLRTYITFKNRTKAAYALVVLLQLVTSNITYTNQETLSTKKIFSRILDAIAQSQVVHQYNKFIANAFDLSGVPASDQMQILGAEAQTAVGILEERHIPIRYVQNLDAAARTTINAIEIGINSYTDHDSYGVKRCDMFHEAIHAKYHDYLFPSISLFGSWLTALAATKLLLNPKGMFKLLYLLTLIAGHHVGRWIQTMHKTYCERRADIEGHYATQCYRCVTEKAQNIKNVRESLINLIEEIEEIESRTDLSSAQDELCTKALTLAKNWLETKKKYLTVEENETIAANLKQDNKLCAVHNFV
jgi:hypothetical protein